MVRLAVSLMVTMVFLAMPIAEASHAETSAIDICAADHDENGTGLISDAEVPDHDHSDHHAHKCGSCHVHLVLRVQSFTGALILADLNLQIGRDQSPALGAPDALYRPPRSFV